MQRRWIEHCKSAQDGSNTVFHQAIRKHGEDSWIHEILQEGISPDDVLEFEKLWIDQCQSHYSRRGYNMTHGGDGMVGVLITEETRKKMSESRKGRFFSVETRDKIRKKSIGRKLSEKSKEKVGTATIERFSDESFKEKHKEKTKEAMKNLSEELREKLRSRRKSVHKISEDQQVIQVFMSITEAAKFEGVTSAAISACIRGRSKKCNGFVWKYAKEDKET
jgi:group I intron endonuclease